MYRWEKAYIMVEFCIMKSIAPILKYKLGYCTKNDCNFQIL